MAKAKNTGMWVLGIFMVLVVFGLIGYFSGLFGTPAQQAVIGVGQNGQPVSAGCNQNPSITTAIVDAESPGTAFTTTNYYRVNDVYVGTTAPTPNAGDSVQILAYNSTYPAIAQILPAFTAHCGGNLVSGSLYKYANATVAYKTDAGTAVLTDAVAGGATNETTMNGGKSWALTVKGTNLASTGKYLYTVELCTPANMSSLTLSENGVALPEVAIPLGVSREGTNMYMKAWEISPTTTATTRTFYLNGAVASGKVCQGGVYTNFYGEQAYVDADGTFKEGAFNSLNTAQYTSTFDSDFFIQV